MASARKSVVQVLGPSRRSGRIKQRQLPLTPSRELRRVLPRRKSGHVVESTNRKDEVSVGLRSVQPPLKQRRSVLASHHASCHTGIRLPCGQQESCPVVPLQQNALWTLCLASFLRFWLPTANSLHEAGPSHCFQRPRRARGGETSSNIRRPGLLMGPRPSPSIPAPSKTRGNPQG